MRRAKPPSRPRMLSPFECLEADEPAFARWLWNERYSNLERAFQWVAREGRLYSEEMEREGTGAHGARLASREQALRNAIEYFNSVDRSLYSLTLAEIEDRRRHFAASAERDPSILEPPPTLEQLLGRPLAPASPEEAVQKAVQDLDEQEDLKRRKQAAVAELKSNDDLSGFIDAKQLEARWGLPSGTVSRMVSFKELPFVSSKNGPLFRLVDIEAIEGRFRDGQTPMRFSETPGSRKRGEMIRSAVLKGQ